jgi:hypothetical protein
MKMYRSAGAAIVMVMLMVCGIAQGTLTPKTYGFTMVPGTGNSAIANSPDLDLNVIVSQSGSLVQFKFENDSTVGSSITQIYFDDNGNILSGIVPPLDWGNQAGVDYHQGATPGNLPGGNNIGFDTTDPTKSFSAGPNPPVSPNGLNPGQWLIINFGFDSGETLANVFSALDNSCLRIGIHVQSIAIGGDCGCGDDGPSASFVTPEPASVILFGIGVLACWRRRRF